MSALGSFKAVKITPPRFTLDAAPRCHFFSLPNLTGGSSGASLKRSHSERKILRQLFNVVSDVKHYHEFVPWCVSSTVLASKVISTPFNNPQGEIIKTLMRAELAVGFHALKESYTSDVVCVHPNRVQATASNSALFKNLVTTWTFTPHIDKSRIQPRKPQDSSETPASLEDHPSCTVDFSISFEFNSILYSRVADAFFTEVCTMMVNAFERRAQAIYGNPK
ncbi:Coenzyme Q-binding protein COQ10 B, mitochondrial [Dinochytrium kinnereticum]|nr:Coenzyme Q-binding protein COQ10 B, mitochondrial [Dinochytrium kinnereticum]